METRKVEVHPENCVGCMLCQMRCSLAYEKMVNPLKSRIIIGYPITGNRGISFKDECEDCGLCANMCTYGALTLRTDQGGNS
ncbi:hypothetical protein ACFL9T_06250 [Thermodesulfobacteriota bacterium]